ncbi:MAG TPA: hypothetical protein VMJ32_15005 [Pirellulales bacterium]|nr:hypothetical protein [Pirellulales bacterium]
MALSLFAVVTPADEVRAAAADVKQLPPEACSAARYLTLYAIDPAKRHEALQVIGYTLNTLSNSRAISPPVLVTPTLVRFSINQYTVRQDEFAAWAAAWEKLAESDPYFHLRTEVLNRQESVLSNKSSPRSGSVHQTTNHRPLTTFLTTDGGWADLNATAQLREATHSAGALLRADYFLVQATTTPHYYEFADVPNTENEFLQSLGVDRAAIDHLHANAGANLVLSGVTAKPRRIVWAQGPLGGVYSTLDVERVDAERDPLRRPITAAGLAFRYDLGEWFALAPNGLWRTALFNSAGRRQDSVPDRVAKDTSDPAGDGIVIPIISCIRCHREAGLRPFTDDETKLLSGRVDLFSPDPTIVQRAVEFYDEPRLQRQMEFDRQTYADAVVRATAGMKPEELAQSLAALFREHAYLPVTPQQAALEVGLNLTQFRQALAATRDPVILLLLENRSVLRGQWESSFAEAALAAEAFRQVITSNTRNSN